MALPYSTIAEVIRHCNRDLVPDSQFNPNTTYHSDWFQDYFQFLNMPKEAEHLGDAFYQARFIYKIMNALQLPLSKQRGFVKFQIIQYASICEAIMDITINRFFKVEAEKYFSVAEYRPYQNALSEKTKIKYDDTPLYICKEYTKKGVLKRTRVDFKTKFAVEKGIISASIKNQLDNLYDQRNNVHILKAVSQKYQPTLDEARTAFLLMEDFVLEVKQFYTKMESGKE